MLRSHREIQWLPRIHETADKTQRNHCKWMCGTFNKRQRIQTRCQKGPQSQLQAVVASSVHTHTLTTLFFCLFLVSLCCLVSNSSLFGGGRTDLLLFPLQNYMLGKHSCVRFGGNLRANSNPRPRLLLFDRISLCANPARRRRRRRIFRSHRVR